ncbi:MAG: MarR family transcriptional regulator [Bacteroides sp. SM23_62]|nr:MAG: MarR family transcriptional regulator [Bacteroides sp. SM23_62]
MSKVHTFEIKIDWKLISEISSIDRFDASWSTIEKREGQTLKQLKSVATVRSVGASTRIEGSKMSDAEVEVLLQTMNIDKLEDRDAQEVVGYFEVFDLISESADSIKITENSLKNLHNQLLKYSSKDQWHKGGYKQHSNSVEASFPDGTTQIIFETTPPGVETEDAMKALINWYNRDTAIHPLVKCAIFTYEFVSIHPFQDGNGRLSRLLSTLLLLKHGYKWIQYVSFEHEIEYRKKEYYTELRKCQAQRPGEDVTSWVLFFLSTLKNIQSQLMEKLERTGVEARLSPREKSILAFLSDHPGSKSGAVAARLNIPNPTVKRIMRDLVTKNLIEVFGTGPGTNYSVK